MGNFGPVISLKYGPKTAPKEPNFKNWLKTHPKVINAWNKHVIHHFGGMLALKSGLRFFCFVIRNAIFWHLKTAKVPVFKCQKMGLWVIHPKSEKIGGVYLSAQKNWRKKCVNLDDKILRQKGINHKNVMNLWQNSIFTYKIWYLCVFI